MARLAVAHVCRTGWPVTGGLPVSVHGLARSLVQRGHDAWVVTLDEHDGVPLREGWHEGVQYRRVPRVGPRRYPTARHLPRAVAGADVVHVHGLDGLADQLLALPGRRVPVGVSTHGGYLHTARHARLKWLWLRTVTRLSLARADAVWFTSAADRDRLRPAFHGGRILEDGVDVARFLEVSRRPEIGRWVVPGRVDVHKGLDDLIDVLGQLRRRGEAPERVEITGSSRVPGLVDTLEARARDRGVHDLVRFVGVLDDDGYAACLARAELALFPSRREGFGIAAVEAMAAGLPVVLADIPAFRDRVRQAVDGWLAPFRDPDRAARRLARIRRADLPRVGAAARRRARRFGWSYRVRAWEAAYRGLIRRAPP